MEQQQRREQLEDVTAQLMLLSAVRKVRGCEAVQPHYLWLMVGERDVAARHCSRRPGPWGLPCECARPAPTCPPTPPAQVEAAERLGLDLLREGDCGEAAAVLSVLDDVLSWVERPGAASLAPPPGQARCGAGQGKACCCCCSVFVGQGRCSCV